MTDPASPLVRRIAAVAMLLVVIMAAWWLVVQPVASAFTSLDSDRQAAYREIAKARAFADSAPSLARAVTELNESTVWHQLLDGETRTAAETALLSDVRGFLDPSATISSLEPLPPKTENGLTRVGVRLQGNLTIESLRTFIERTETSPKLLRLGSISVTAQNMQSSLAPAQNEMLSLRADVFGWTRVSEERK